MQLEHIKRENRMDKLEQQVREALFSRTTAHLGEHRILKNAFTKFDKVCVRLAAGTSSVCSSRLAHRSTPLVHL